MVPRIRIGMDSCSSQSDFVPLVNVLENPSDVGEAPGVMSMLGDGAPQEPERNIHLANNKDEDEEDEVFGSEREMESQEKRTARIRTRKRMIPGAGRKNVKFPCGVCGAGVGTSGIMCCACCLWIHNGKIKQCAGLSGRDVTQADTFRCPKCLECNLEINLELRNEMVALSKKKSA